MISAVTFSEAGFEANPQFLSTVDKAWCADTKRADLWVQTATRKSLSTHSPKRSQTPSALLAVARGFPSSGTQQGHSRAVRDSSLQSSWELIRPWCAANWLEFKARETTPAPISYKSSQRALNLPKWCFTVTDENFYYMEPSSFC